MSNSTIGSELELTLIDENGYTTNNAPQILDDPRIKEKKCYTDEGTKAQIEVNSAPAHTIHELDQNLQSKLKFLEDICREYGSFPVPVSEFGAGQGEWNYCNRLKAYLNIIGEHALRNLLPHSGTHLHISQIPGKELQQYYLLQALDPLTYAITSTSSISYKRTNSLNCHRINNQRNIAFKNFPLHAQLQDYPLSLDELKERDNKRWKQWLKISVNKGMPPEKYLETFQPDNTGYHPIRKRDEIGPTGTFEIRSLDICPSDVRSAASALIKGVHDYVMSRNILLAIADKFGEYSFTDKQIVLPHIETSRRSQDLVIDDGLKPDLIFNFLFHLLPFAEQGLPKEDQQYLKHFQEIRKTRMNPAHQIMQYMKSLGYTGSEFSPEQTAQASLFMRTWHQKTLNYQPFSN